MGSTNVLLRQVVSHHLPRKLLAVLQLPLLELVRPTHPLLLLGTTFQPLHQQRTEEMLRDNLRSPQVQQALHNLTMALAGESGGDGEGVSMESYHSIIANFQMDAQDGAMALASGNPIQAFLDCLLASVKKENKEKEEEAKE